jgi:cytidylate kinase
VADIIAEEKRFFVDELVDDLFSLRPPSWVLMPQLIETTTNLAITGHAILVGHGATMITAELPNVFHVRLTGSLSRRIERVEKNLGRTHEEAAKLVRQVDHKREKYAKAYFHARLDNELHHDLSINTDRISEADAVTLIAQAARRFFSTL